jgi:acyl-CoA thioesterase-1
MPIQKSFPNNRRRQQVLSVLCIILALLFRGPLLQVAESNDLPSSPRQQRVLCFGDSLTAGYGLDPDQAFPALLQKKIDEQGWPFQVVNAGLSGDTTSGGLRRINWLLRQQVDVLLLELGANDGFRGIQPAMMTKNLQGIIDQTKKKYPHVTIVIAGMQMSPNLGPDYTAQFRAVFPRLAEANNATLIPFFLEGVAGRPTLNLPDGIHPTADGHLIVAENVWTVLEPILQSLR